MNKFLTASLLSSFCLAGCPAPDSDFDQAELARYRAALPTMERLGASTATPTVAALGDPAVLPTSSIPLVAGINGSVEGIVVLLDAITQIEPTLFNSETNEFVWGPFDNDDGAGTVAVYIREAGAGADFQFEYAFLRGVGNDLATMVPVILGGATPDPNNEDHGVGITLWDFEADRAFAEANDPDFDPSVGERGRFVAVYGAGPDENNAGAEIALVVAAFRDVVFADEPGAEPVDLDYLYGRYAEAGVTLDFLDWQAPIDVDDPADGVAEDLGVRMAFLNEGSGRAEADAVNGSLDADQRGELVECWDDSLSQTFLSLEILRAGQSEISVTDGDVANCGLFAASLSELNIPALEDIDAELLGALDAAAANGL